MTVTTSTIPERTKALFIYGPNSYSTSFNLSPKEFDLLMASPDNPPLVGIIAPTQHQEELFIHWQTLSEQDRERHLPGLLERIKHPEPF